MIALGEIIWRFVGYSFLLAGMTVMVLGGWVMVSASPAGAFCVENASKSRVFVRAEPTATSDGKMSFISWMDPGAKRCAKPNAAGHRVAVFVFADDEAIEGCDAEVAGDQTLRLTSFEEFDRCEWQGHELVIPK